MLIIRNKQMDAMRTARCGDFRRRLGEFIMATSAARAHHWGAEQIESEVAAALQWAADCHLRREMDIVRLTELFCSRLGGFQGMPVGREGLGMLYAYGENPAVKLERFSAWLKLKEGRGS